MKKQISRALALLLGAACLLSSCAARESGAVDGTDVSTSPASQADALPHYDLSEEEVYVYTQSGPFEAVCQIGGTERFQTNSEQITVSNQSDFEVTVYLYIGVAEQTETDEPDLQIPLAIGETGSFQNLTSRQLYSLGAAVPEGAEGTLEITVSD